MEAHLTVEEGPDAGQVFVLVPDTTQFVGKRGDPAVTFGLRDPALPPGGLVAVRLDAQGVRFMGHETFAAALNDAPLPPRAATQGHGGDALQVGAHVLRLELFGAPAAAAAPAPPRQAAPGSEVPADEFTVERQLGQGATGRVYAAVRRADGRRVAVKVLWEWLELNGPDHERFVREAHIARQMQSPYIVQVLDLRLAKGRPMIVMELVDGPSLEDRLDPLGDGWPIADAMRIAEDVARGLAAAASRGVVHRDVKPGNVLLSPVEGRCKLTDFGIARKLSDSVRALTRSGEGLGTLVYMPPEQITEAKTVDARADLYSLGCLLHELVAGTTPFPVDTVDDLVAVMDQDPPKLTTIQPECPPELEALVLHLLEKHPDDRPASSAVVAEQLAAMRAARFPGHTGDSIFRSV